ncbi:MAG: 5-carboxymethyl-2-hydroxymuconate semialdehyde dehydrogenase [Candidatus Bipolaricaulia bacterium]
MTDQMDPSFIEGIRERLHTATLQHFVDGSFMPGQRTETFETLDPSTNRRLSTVCQGHAEDVDRAARAAKRAFNEHWGSLKAKERKGYLLRIADAIDDHADELAVLECLDAGQALRIVRKLVGRSADNFRFYADYAEHAMDGRSFPVDDDFLNYSVRQPIGPVGIITPWNAPMMLSTWRIAPALAAGDTVIHKPAEWAPLSAWKLAEILQEADLPPGVFNVVHGFGETAGAPLTSHPDVPLIALTGETTTGSTVMKNGADQLKRLSLEMGGKSPALVFADADLERALDAVVFQIYSFNGERCTANSRLLVEESIFDDFVDRVAERAANVQVGHPLEPGTEVGPLIHPEHLERVLGFLEQGKHEGADVLAGGHQVGNEGNYLAPTLFVGDNGMTISREEIFGPVLTAIPFRDEAEALKIANDTRYGLAAYVWTKDTERAHRLSGAIEAGMVWVNSQNVRHLPTPFGGMKHSGISREGGHHAFEFYTDVKNVCVPLGEHHIPKFGKGG